MVASLRSSQERGVALLTVLLLVAVMSALAVAIVDDIRFAVRRLSNARTYSQAQWYALGSETLARSLIGRLISERPDGVSLPNGRQGVVRSYAIDQGRITSRLTDLGACFNLNSVVDGAAGEATANPRGVAQLAALLRVLDVSEADAGRIAWSLADWIDADSVPSQGGAEDETYQRRTPAYSTSGVLLAEESELLAVDGVTPEIYARLRPYVCALPQGGPAMISVNALAPQDAPVLSALYGGKLSVDAARRVIQQRPAGGWRDHTAFTDVPELSVPEVRAATPIQQLALASRYFGLETDVDLGTGHVTMSALLDATPSGLVRTVARRWSRPD